MNTKTSLLFLFIIGLFISGYGCASSGGRYVVEGVKYDVTQEALNAVKDSNNKEVEKITPTKTSIGGKASLFMLSESMINGTLALAYSKVSICFPKSDKDFMTGKYKLMSDFLEQIIKKRAIFKEVICSVSDNPEKDAANAEGIAIYTTMTSKGVFQTYLKKKGKDPVLINADVTLGTKLERNISFLDAIERAANK